MMIKNSILIDGRAARPLWEALERAARALGYVPLRLEVGNLDAVNWGECALVILDADAGDVVSWIEQIQARDAEANILVLSLLPEEREIKEVLARRCDYRRGSLDACDLKRLLADKLGRVQADGGAGR